MAGSSVRLRALARVCVCVSHKISGTICASLFAMYFECSNESTNVDLAWALEWEGFESATKASSWAHFEQNIDIHLPQHYTLHHHRPQLTNNSNLLDNPFEHQSHTQTFLRHQYSIPELFAIWISDSGFNSSSSIGFARWTSLIIPQGTTKTIVFISVHHML